MSNSLSKVHPELISEWSDRNYPLTPDNITFGSNKMVWWKRGKIEGYKVDGEEKGLAGATFGLFDEWAQEYTAENAYMTVTSDENGYFAFDNVPYGDYVVVELEAPEGFLLDENVYPFSIVNDKEVVVIENEAGVGFSNQPIRGEITVFKTDEATGDKLVGAGFRVFDTGYTTTADSSAYMISLSNREEKIEWLKEMFHNSDFYSDVTVYPYDHIVTFSTCEYSFQNARYVVHGKMVEITD